MLSIDQNSQVSAYVQQTVLSWINLYNSFNTVSDLSELSNGKFFLVLLQTLPNFKLLTPITQLCQDNSLAAKVTIIKNISKSVINYHQTKLLRDVSELEINYVQLCMGNKKELFRLISIILSALYSQNGSRLVLQEKMEKMNQDQRQVLKIMIQNSLNLGQQYNSNGGLSSRSWRLSEQKKIISKMEILQNKIEELEIINKNLQETIRVHKQAEDVTDKENKRLKEEIKRLANINDELIEENQKTINQLKISSIEQTSAKKKYQVIKVKLQQKIHKLQSQLQKLTQQRQQTLHLKQKIGNLTQINTQIKQENKQLRSIVQKFEHERMELKKIQKMHMEEFITLKKHCSELEIKVQELLLACSLKSEDAANLNNYRTCYFGKRSQHHEESQQQLGSDSNRYRIKDNLEFINNQHMYSITTQHNNNKENNQNASNINNEGTEGWVRNQSDKFQIRTITERSLEDSVCLEKIKENQSFIMNNSDLLQFQQSFGKEVNNGSEKQLKIKQFIKECSQNNVQNDGKQYIDQIKVLTSIILDLQEQLQYERKNSRLNSGHNYAIMDPKRKEKYLQKLRQMFNPELLNQAF